MSRTLTAAQEMCRFTVYGSLPILHDIKISYYSGDYSLGIKQTSGGIFYKKELGF